MTCCTQSRSSLHSRLLYCTAGGPSGTTALLGVFQTVQTTFPLCWVSWAWADGVSRRDRVIPAVINLCFELKNDVEAERHMFAFVCHMSDDSTRTVHRPFYGHWRVGGPEAALFLAPKCCLGLYKTSLIDWLNLFHRSKKTYGSEACLWHTSEKIMQ